MKLVLTEGPMDGAVYSLDPYGKNTTRKPDGLWFDAQDEQGRWVRHEYRELAPSYIEQTYGRIAREVEIVYGHVGGYVCEHGVKDGDWCEPCNKAEKEARMDPENGVTADHICVGGSAADEAAGMAWWNSMSYEERRSALDAVGHNASPAEAYQWHLIHVRK